jgi:hypothetical protein
MKKTIFKYLFVAALTSVFISCSEDDVNTFNGPTTNYFAATSYSINATDDSNTGVEVEIVSTDISTAARSYNVEVDPSSTAVLGTDFTLANNSITIPAGEYSGKLLVTSILTPNTSAGASVVLNLVGSTDISIYNSSATISISHAKCGLTDDAGTELYVGDYTVEQIAGDNTFGEAIVETTVTLASDGMMGRSFESLYLRDFGQAPMTFTFDLNCGNALPGAEMETNLNCSELILLTGIVTSYNTFDDEVLDLTFSEVISADCGAAQSTTTTIRLTKVN